MPPLGFVLEICPIGLQKRPVPAFRLGRHLPLRRVDDSAWSKPTRLDPPGGRTALVSHALHRQAKRVYTIGERDSVSISDDPSDRRKARDSDHAPVLAELDL